MYIRLIIMLIGFGFFIIGVVTKINGGSIFHGYPINDGAGIIISILGAIIFIWAAFSKKLNIEKKSFVICPKCKETFYEDQITNKMCPNCKTDVERIEGFYERHPDDK